MYLVFYSSAYGLAHFCERGTISLIINVKSTAISVDYNSLHPTEEDKKKRNFFFPPFLFYLSSFWRQCGSRQFCATVAASSQSITTSPLRSTCAANQYRDEPMRLNKSTLFKRSRPEDDIITKKKFTSPDHVRCDDDDLTLLLLSLHRRHYAATR